MFQLFNSRALYFLTEEPTAGKSHYPERLLSQAFQIMGPLLYYENLNGQKSFVRDE
jgi:hypothetical protein